MDEKKKQAIEEIASIICKETSNKGVCEKCDFKKHKQFGFVYQCSKFDNAEEIYNAGYRKESDTARELAKTIKSVVWEEFENETIRIKDLHGVIDDILRSKYGVDLWE